MFVRLSSDVVVSPAMIEAVYIDGDPHREQCIVVRTTSGHEFRIGCRYRSTIYETHDAILREITDGSVRKETS